MKFSIITITHNRVHLIGNTIQSVLNQTYTSFEHIIIDDGSIDNTQEVVEAFKDDRIRYFKYAKHPFRSYLRNEGIRKSEGDIICILDSDDLWLPDKLACLHAIFGQNENIVFLFHNAYLLAEELSNDRLYSYKNDFHKSVFLEVLKSKLLPYPFYSFRKDILQNVNKYDETLTDGQQDFFLRVTSQYAVYYCSKVLAHKRHHKQNLSQKYRLEPLLDYLKSIDKLLLNDKISKKQYDQIVGKINYKIAKFYVDNFEVKKGLQYIMTQTSKSSFGVVMISYFYRYFKLYLYSKSI